MSEQLLDTLTERVRDNALFKQYRLEVMGLGDLLSKRVRLRDQIRILENLVSVKKAVLLATGQIDGKNEQIRAAQVLQALSEDEAVSAAQSEINQFQMALSGVDIALAVVEKMIGVYHDEARVLAAALQATATEPA